MSELEIVQAPLLGRALGTAGTTFAVHENHAEASALPRRGIPLHLHRTEDEAWYVLEGSLRFQYGTREFDAAAGAGVLLPHGIPHTFWNPGPTAARYLLIVGPQTEGLLGALHGPVAPGAKAAKDVYASFDADLLE